MATGIKAPAQMDFTNAQEERPRWIQRFQQFRQASGLDEKSAQQQVDILVYLMGEEAEKVYAQLVIEIPSNEEAKENPEQLYENTVTAFTNYFNPTSNQLHYSIMLSNCGQKQRQRNEEFTRELYELIERCGFSEAEKALMLRMRLLAGMQDKSPGQRPSVRSQRISRRNQEPDAS